MKKKTKQPCLGRSFHFQNKNNYFQSWQNLSNFKKVFQFFLHLQYYEQTAHFYDGRDHTVNNGKENIWHLTLTLSCWYYSIDVVGTLCKRYQKYIWIFAILYCAASECSILLGLLWWIIFWLGDYLIKIFWTKVF